MLREVGDFDRDACSFVIRLWREIADEQAQDEWRGWITHVQSGNRMFFQDTAEIIPFVDKYLEPATRN